ncbi:MAG: hypothetical protein VW493_09420, partial [Gammaproteobacteria bacterium]
TYESFTGYGPVSSQNNGSASSSSTTGSGAKHSRQTIVVYKTEAKNESHSKFDHLPATAGTAMINGHRSQFIDHTGKRWTCALSGMGRRKITNQHGIEIVVGNAETLLFQQTTTAHLPSNHRSEARCIVLINKQPTNIDAVKRDLLGE